jgi:hypothetical protein
VKTSFTARDLSIVMNAIEEAWLKIEVFPYAKSAPFVPGHWHNEDELTTKLMEILNNALAQGATVQASRFSKKVFSWVVRDGKQTSGDLDSIDQMPDLTFRKIRSNDEEDEESALYVEAKVIKQPKGCRPYVVDGMHRFVSGRYAPRMGFGLMLGYAHPPYSNANSDLAAYFAGVTAGFAVKCKATLTDKGAPHRRSFLSAHRRASPHVSPFTAIHLWLEVP